MVQKVEYLIVDTTAFINNVPLQEISSNVMTIQEVVDEITNKRQLKRLVVLPYDLIIKDVFTENIKIITDFSKKTGDYPSLSATDIKVMALTYQMEKEKVGTSHLRNEPMMSRVVEFSTKVKKQEIPTDVTGFYLPSRKKDAEGSDAKEHDSNGEETVTSDTESEENDDFCEKLENDNEQETDKVCEEEEDIDVVERNEEQDLSSKFATLDCGELEDVIDGQKVNDILATVKNDDVSSESESGLDDNEDDDEEGWITPNNIQKAKKQMNDGYVEDKPVTVACITTDFAMQNVLKQMNLNVSALDGRMIKQIRTFILRCHTCFKTTSIMEKVFCPKCGNKTLKKVAVSLNENGKQVIHINGRKPLTCRGKKFSLPTPKGGKHSNNPILFEDQPVPQQRQSRQARMKNNPMDPDYIAAYSPFVMRDVNSRSALLGIRGNTEVKYWMKKNPNEARRKRK